MKKINAARGLIHETGGNVNEVTSLKVEDIKMDAYGHLTVHIGIGDCERHAIVDKGEVLKELLEDARADGREMLLPTIPLNFDCSNDRAIYARRLYALVSAGGRMNSKSSYLFDGKKYDGDAMRIVAKCMGEKDVKSMDKYFKLEI